MPEEDVPVPTTGTPVSTITLLDKYQPNMAHTEATELQPGMVRVEPTAWLLGQHAQRVWHGYNGQQDEDSPLAAACVGYVAETRTPAFKVQQAVLVPRPCALATLVDVPADDCVAVESAEQGYLAAAAHAFTAMAIERITTGRGNVADLSICIIGDSYAARLALDMLQRMGARVTHFIGTKLALLGEARFDGIVDCRLNADYTNAHARLNNTGQYTAVITGNVREVSLPDTERGVESFVPGTAQDDFMERVRTSLNTVRPPAFLNSHPAEKFVSGSTFRNVPAALAGNGGFYIITK